MLVELRDKVTFVEGEFEEETTSVGIKADAIAALVSLGYNQKQANNAVNKALAQKPGVSIEELIRIALTQVNQ